MSLRKSLFVLDTSSIPSPIKAASPILCDDISSQLITINNEEDNFLEYNPPACNSANHELNVSFIERSESQESSILGSCDLERPMLPCRETESFITTDTSTEAEEQSTDSRNIVSIPISNNSLSVTLQNKSNLYNLTENSNNHSYLATQKIHHNDNKTVVIDAINNDIKVISSLLYEGGFRRWSLDDFKLSNMDVSSEVWNRKMIQCRTDMIKEFEKDQMEAIYLVQFRQFITHHSYLESAQKAMSELEKFDELHSLVNRARNMWMQQLLFNIAKVSQIEFEKFAQKVLNFDFIGIDKQSLINCISLIRRDFNVVDKLNTLPSEDMKNTTFLRHSLYSPVKGHEEKEGYEDGFDIIPDKVNSNDNHLIDEVNENKNNGVNAILIEDKTLPKEKKPKRFTGILRRVIKFFRKNR